MLNIIEVNKMDKIKKIFWMTLGFIFLGIAYIGLVTPGIPWSTPTVIAAFCFAKGSKKWHDWIMNHKLFGPFLRNWSEKRVFPTAGKWAMFITMDISLIIIWLTTGSWKMVLGVGLVMMLVAFWAWKYPGSVEEYEARKLQGRKIGWFK
jgi:uncharacterized membrane protein YbaN (DUF454 family)